MILKFGYNTNSLTEYIDEQRFPLLTKTLLIGKTASLLTPMLGVKDKDKVNITDTGVTFQAPSCTPSTSPSGTTTFTQRELTVGKIMVAQTVNPSDLENFYLQTKLQKGSNYTTIPFEQEWVDFQVRTISQQNEIALWQGDTSSGNQNYSKFDGLIKLIDAATATTVHASTSTINASNIVAIMNDIVAKIPAQLLNSDDLRIWMGWDAYRTLAAALTTANLYHYTTDSGFASGELIYPGTSVRITAVNGLNSTNRIFAFRQSNGFLGTDLYNEYESNVYFGESLPGSKCFLFRVDYKLGTQFAFAPEIVEYHNS